MVVNIKGAKLNLDRKLQIDWVGVTVYVPGVIGMYITARPTFPQLLPPLGMDLAWDEPQKHIRDHQLIQGYQGRWNAFNEEPKDQSGGESTVFKPMTHIFDNIVDVIIANSNLKLTTKDCSVNLDQNPSSTPTLAARYNATRPDGYLLLKDRFDDKIISWADIALLCEYKREDGMDELDDARCAEVYMEMTIENAMTQIWFCCRSSVVVSEPFNFISEPEALVELFAAFAFANRLGFDPTAMHPPGDLTQFIITVHPHDNNKPRRFCTRKIISSLAIEVDEGGREKGNPVVLKDIWIDHDCLTEGAILTQLYEEADEEDKKLVQRHFLTTICRRDVLMEPGVPDGTQDLMRRLNTAQDGVFELRKRLVIDSKHKVASGSQGLRETSWLHVPHPDLMYLHKMHCRIIFEAKGVTIDLVLNLRDVMKALTDISMALQLLRKLGWVHWGISIGNILYIVVQQRWQAGRSGICKENR
ncbi:hypothetical protein BS47DRAFT_1416692 [Hydnum rufescens UP504]|uniref:Fungal-type protein kinase domain-containing protein n=1 Tax=Hydnum rufescens UP504 TaxID=1448309 RepID=A0A9P6AM85_9AGAM|nr:hypothetical protein BS47DRAFT_1416692 [Hydnum rufescens UP504]